MEVLLNQNVPDLGRMGDIVEVADGYARNYLLPKKLAMEVSQANLRMIDHAREARAQREKEEVDRVQDQAQKLAGFLCFIEARATERGHLFGSVGPEQVAQSLVESGFEAIRPANVNMARHIEELGDSEVEIMLHPEVRVKITLRIARLEEEIEGRQ